MLKILLCHEAPHNQSQKCLLAIMIFHRGTQNVPDEENFSISVSHDAESLCTSRDPFFNDNDDFSIGYSMRAADGDLGGIIAPLNSDKHCRGRQIRVTSSNNEGYLINEADCDDDDDIGLQPFLEGEFVELGCVASLLKLATARVESRLKTVN